MNKVLVDRELLELLRNFTFLHDDGFAGAIRGNIDKALAAQPAEAEGARDYLAEFVEGEVEAKTAIEELQDALSAVTAERDRLDGENERLVRDAKNDAIAYRAVIERQEELRAEVEGMRKAFLRMRNVAAGYSNCCEFDSANTRRLEREFEAADELFLSSAAMAAKEA